MWLRNVSGTLASFAIHATLHIENRPQQILMRAASLSYMCSEYLRLAASAGNVSSRLLHGVVVGLQSVPIVTNQALTFRRGVVTRRVRNFE